MKKIFAGLALSFFLCTPGFADATDQQPVLIDETNIVNSENAAMESTESEALPNVLVMAGISMDNDETREVKLITGPCALYEANCIGSVTSDPQQCSAWKDACDKQTEH